MHKGKMHRNDNNDARGNNGAERKGVRNSNIIDKAASSRFQMQSPSSRFGFCLKPFRPPFTRLTLVSDDVAEFWPSEPRQTQSHSYPPANQIILIIFILPISIEPAVTLPSLRFLVLPRPPPYSHSITISSPSRPCRSTLLNYYYFFSR